ncbi:hypothetical protein A3H89_02435 [Candidatus Amesbacteria bacterium RIFCSPLOWO2_02_FULL_48_11]|uniref:Uncharacterized protein n=5 Tax=Candidatus Amesiibacteriota TaxID=1752730 RepID=A0A1F4ZCB0_9BACT|nr:MAG: hypothetical protein UX78_C0015G0038 [Candidatus Amesbacteria bacterium GW2011_GWA2_47_11]KKU91969.1 MAG: hypothetical protein UY22_C0041G0002 [Candidatus Amesbacteria bacterium GW2011_GWC1_48_10]KKU99514.1 MAG: hypothetical protein UY33_C0029G0002 [Candidatus Amesbacteria bacterium GW2011_GWA1_48_9]OGC90350.1 MAG: hypothetical protein A2V48_00555 [Candidatus Amesbacteria bacterium RBG_19FT_COMBO_48_16]OGC96406.1 MAG: hypothetical protein A3C34_02120 [Candidatus Amesbacteria bacterium R
MSKIFYDHLVIREDITAVLDSYDLDPVEREELVGLIDSHLHHHILNIILNHLPKSHHADFISRVIAAPHDTQILEFVRSKVSVDIEEEIKSHAAKIKTDLLSEIHKSRRK